MRADDIALVVRQELRRAPFARVDVEMVEPEIDEDLLQLPLAVHRAKELLGCERLDLPARELAQFLLVR